MGPELAMLVARLDKLEEDNARLEATIRALEADRADRRGTSAHSSAAADALSRRRLLRLGGAAAAGAGVAVAASVVGASPAAATTGTMQYGTTNNAGTAKTVLTNSADGTACLEVRNNSSSFTVDATGVYGVAKAPSGMGAYGGVVGDSESTDGVVGLSAEGTGVSGIAAVGIGVKGLSKSSSPGVWGECENDGYGVYGISNGRAAGVFGFGDNVGVEGYSPSGYGVLAVGGKAPLYMRPSAAKGKPDGDHSKGELYVDNAGVLWLCTASGNPTSGGFPALWVQVRTSADGSGFNPLTPARVLDTRSGAPVGSGSTNERVVQVGGVAGISTTATAAAINITVTQASASGGFLTVYPDGTTRPTASNINFNAGQTIANFAVVKLGSSGKIRVYNQTGTVHVLLDVAGYYT